MNFLKDITIGQYVPGNSMVHQLDPRVKIALVFIMMIQIFLNRSLVPFVLFILLLIGITLLSNIHFHYVMRGLRPITFLVILTLFFNLFFTSGKVLWQSNLPLFFHLKITYEGLTTGVQLAFQLLLLVFCTSLLTLTTSPIQLTDALENILTPLKIIKIPAHELAMMMTIALRFIPVLIEETEKIIKAQRSRGAAFGRGNLIEKAKSLLPILVPLFVHAFKHAEDLASAMESRCYRGGEGRTRLKQLKIKWQDLLATILVGAILTGAAWWNFYGGL